MIIIIILSKNMRHIQVYVAVCIFVCCQFSPIFGAEEYQRFALSAHNVHRAKHRVRPLILNDQLSAIAAKCAMHYANSGRMDHSCPFKNGTGENLFSRWPDFISDQVAVREAIKSWYSESVMHIYLLGFQPSTGHFTQIVWKGSKELGIGTARVGMKLTVCALYSPAGNIINQFKTNVFRP